MIAHGLLVATAGFLFIFAPGLPIGVLARRGPPFQRELIYWGIAVWVLAQPPSLFLQSLLRQVAAPAGTGAEARDYALTLAGALISAALVQGGMYLLLRREARRHGPAGLALSRGLPLGFGLGLASQVFAGLALVGAGFRLMWGDTREPLLAELAQQPWPALALALLPLVLFRPALLVVSAIRGVLVARAVAGQRRWLAAAVGLDAAFTWSAVALQLALDRPAAQPAAISASSPVLALLHSLYYAAVFALALRWLWVRLGRRPEPRARAAV